MDNDLHVLAAESRLIYLHPDEVTIIINGEMNAGQGFGLAITGKTPRILNTVAKAQVDDLLAEEEDSHCIGPGTSSDPRTPIRPHPPRTKSVNPGLE